jgi:hypothetical protein
LLLKMTAASLRTFRIIGIKKHVISVCFICIWYATCYAWQYKNTILCDVATFYVLFLFDFVNLNSGNVFLCTFFFYSAWSVFFCNPPLPVFATTHSIKLPSLTCVISATVFFFAIAAHQRSGMFAIILYFHEVATTSSKDQTSHTKLFYQFLQSQSHCYKGV